MINCTKHQKLPFFNKKWPKNYLEWFEMPFFYIDPICLCLTSITFIGMRFFFKTKDQRVDLLPNSPKSGHFSIKKWKKWHWMAKSSIFYIDPTLSCLKSIQLSQIRLFCRNKRIYCQKHWKQQFFIKNGPKIYLNG